jgi:hypothetical protein
MKAQVTNERLDDLQQQRQRGVPGAQEEIDKYFFGPGRKAEKLAKLKARKGTKKGRRR